MSIVTFEVPTAHCGSCRADIETSLRALRGVRHADVDLRSRKVTVAFDPRIVQTRALAVALRSAGYPPAGVTASGRTEP